LRLSSQLLDNEKGPLGHAGRRTTAASEVPGTVAPPEIELLTETSTQIRVSENRKLHLSTVEEEQQMITGTLVFGKYFLRSNFRASRK